MTRDVVYLKHILDAISRIEQYAAVSQEQFFAEPLRQDATIRQLEIIGEATKRISKNMRASHPEVPWQKMAATRDVLIHNYMGVDLGVIWEVAHEDIPDLRPKLEAILETGHS